MSNSTRLNTIRERIAKKHNTLTANKTAEAMEPRIVYPKVKVALVKPVAGEWIHKPGDEYHIEGFDLNGNPLNFTTSSPILAKRTILQKGKKWAIRKTAGIRQVVERIGVL